MENIIMTGIETLHLEPAIKKDLRIFLEQVIDFYQKDLLSVLAFGSCVTGDYASKISDVNLLVVYSDLNIADLKQVAGLAQRWYGKRGFAPRFLSKRNLLGSARYFQIDMLEMKDAHVLLYGEDIFAHTPISLPDLHWQLSHEIKAMRMRIKQQFWRTSSDPASMKRVLIDRFSSLIHLIRAALYISRTTTPVGHKQIMDIACGLLHIDADFVSRMFSLKSGMLNMDKDELIGSFTNMIDIIRIVDTYIDGLSV